MNAAISARDPRAEAQALVGDQHRAIVLEPSPPAVTEGPWFADDPVAVGPARSSERLVMPRSLPGDLDWDGWLAASPDNGDHRAWATSSWLGADRRLPPVPADLATTRVDLHRLAVYVIAPARHQANGKFGLRWTRGGFGTPFFAGPDGEDRQIRVEGTTLVDQRGGAAADGGTVRTTTITTLAAAAAFLGTEIDTETAAEHDSPELGDPEAELQIDPAAAEFLGQWYGMAFAALEVVRAHPGSDDPSRPQLWPGHFDPAIEVGDEDHRGSYGASPGDPAIDEPYLYLSIWWPDRIGVDADDAAWNAPSFTGSILKLSEFPADQDPVETASRFWLDGRDRLA